VSIFQLDPAHLLTLLTQAKFHSIAVGVSDIASLANHQNVALLTSVIVRSKQSWVLKKYGELLLSLSRCKMMRTIYVRKINKVLQWIRRSKQSCVLKKYGRLIGLYQYVKCYFDMGTIYVRKINRVLSEFHGIFWGFNFGHYAVLLFAISH